MPKIRIDYSGWCEADTDYVIFRHLPTNDVINFEKYNTLTVEEKGNCILESIMDVIHISSDGEWTDTDFEIVDD